MVMKEIRVIVVGLMVNKEVMVRVRVTCLVVMKDVRVTVSSLIVMEEVMVTVIFSVS